MKIFLRNKSVTLLLSAIIFFALHGRSSAAQTYQYVGEWGTYGSGSGQFHAIKGLSVDSSGNVYVADAGNNRIQKFDSNGAYLTQWGSYGGGNSQFIYLYGVAADQSGNSYTVEQSYSLVYDGRIQKFDSGGAYVTQWGNVNYGSADGQFDSPSGVAVDTSGNVYVADAGNYRVQKFDSSGAYLTKWSTGGNLTGLAVDGSGNVYVVDDFNNRIQKFDPTGALVTEWGTYGSGEGQFKNPSGVAVDSAGNVYVADTINYRIQKFDSNGGYLTQWGSNGSGSGQFSYLYGVAVDSAGNVYASDYSRVEKFTPVDILTITVAGATGSSSGSITGGRTLACSVAANGSTSGTCVETDNRGTSLTLTAAPAPGAYVTWSGCEASSGNTCDVTLDADTIITAYFTLSVNAHNLTVNKAGAGTGRVTSNPPGINCGNSCASSSADFPLNQAVMLTATPSTGGSIFSGWSGDPDCTDGSLTMSAERSCTATFDLCDAASLAMTSSSALFDSITSAYLAAAPTDMIKVVASNQDEGDLVAGGKDLIVQGGYDCAFSEPPTSFTTVTGSLTIADGSLILGGIAIK